jgi:hypothetical protein
MTIDDKLARAIALVKVAQSVVKHGLHLKRKFHANCLKCQIDKFLAKIERT